MSTEMVIENPDDPSFSVPKIKLWRPFKKTDLPHIIALLRPSSFELFGNFDLDYIVHTSNHTVVMENQSGQLIAAISLRNYPLIPAVWPEIWLECIQNHYRLNDVNYENTLFVHLLLWDQRYDWEFLGLLLQSQFMATMRLQCIIMVAPPMTEAVETTSEKLFQYCFTRLLPVDQKEFSRCQTLYVAYRQSMLPPIKIRYAVAEDNDDLVEILDRTQPMLKAMYGDLYLAEIILDSTSTRRIIVAEQNGVASGMLGLNTNLSLNRLLLHYEVLPYNAFRKQMANHKYVDFAQYADDGPDGLESTTLKSRNSWNTEGTRNESMYNVDSQRHSETPSLAAESDYEEDDEYTHGIADILHQLQDRNTSSDSDANSSRSFDLNMAKISNDNIDTAIETEFTIINEMLNDDIDIIKNMSDVFFIELYGMCEHLDPRDAYYLLEAAFEVYPDRNYCLISVPTTTRYFPLLKYFVRVVSRLVRGSASGHSLYICHRGVMFNGLRIRIATIEDEPIFIEFLKNICNGELGLCDMMMEAIRKQYTSRSFEPSVYPFIAVTGNVVVGAFILESYNDVRYLQHHFNVDQFMDLKFYDHYERNALIKCFILHPAYMQRVPFVFSELFRTTGIRSLYYQLFDNKRTHSHLKNSALSDMFPVRPRIHCSYKLNAMHSYQRPAEWLQKPLPHPFALYHMNIGQCELRKVQVNKKIIVVGCSETALAFIEELIFNYECRLMYITNITLVAPNGFGNSMMTFDDNASKFFPTATKYRDEYMKKLSLRSWVTIYTGQVTKIIRDKRRVIVNGSKELRYDRLYLFCGLQYDYSLKVGLVMEPSNVFLMNTVQDVKNLMNKLVYVKNTANNRHVILYGSGLDTYACINLLLTFKSLRITVIRPHQSNQWTIFNDTYIDDRMRNLLSNSRVQLMDNYEFAGWHLNSSGDVSKVMVQSNHNLKELHCSLLVFYEKKYVHRNTIAMLDNAKLVFDGRLVINELYETNDDHIYAAGPMTKYKRALYADRHRHQYYDSSEIGRKLAKHFLDETNPLIDYKERVPCQRIHRTVHQFRKPKVEYAAVLSGLHYLCIRKPGALVSHELAKTLKDYGYDLVTNDGDEYFRIHLNQYNFIETIVCLSKHPIDWERYKLLWGKHESLLGNLRTRFSIEPKIVCFYEYFNQSWTAAIFHDRFIELENINNEVMRLHGKSADFSIMNEIMQEIATNNWQKLNESRRAEILQKYSGSAYEHKNSENLIAFLVKHADELSMYYARHFQAK